MEGGSRKVGGAIIFVLSVTKISAHTYYRSTTYYVVHIANTCIAIYVPT